MSIKCGYCKRTFVTLAEADAHVGSCPEAPPLAPGQFILPARFHAPNGVHLEKVDAGYSVNCSECGDTMVCPNLECAGTVHYHEDCSRFVNFMDRIAAWWWRAEGLRRRVKRFPRFLTFHFLIWWYSNIAIQRAGLKHARMSPTCLYANPRCIALRYSWTHNYDFRFIGYSCTNCGWVIEGKWREMGPLEPRDSTRH